MENESPPIQVRQNDISEIKEARDYKKIGIIGIFVAIFVLFAVATALSLRPGQGGPNSTEKANEKKTSLANNTIVYGHWTNDSSIVRSKDLSTGVDTVLATLPLNIKHVKIISSNKIAYIKGTDEYDHGKEIVIRNTKDNSEQTVVVSDNNYGIDDYVISPNGQFISSWELVISQNGSVSGGRSRVYSVRVGGTKNLLYDDAAGPGLSVHYPLAITDSGEVFTDKFLPNSGAGYGYGISFSSFDGGIKEEILELQNGNYSTQPILSPNGKYLAFAGYDGSKGPGTEDVDGARRAIVSPNTVDVFDLSTRQKTTLVPAKDGILYPFVFWDQSNNSVIFSQVSKNEQSTGTYIVDIKKNVASAPDIFSSLQGGKFLEIQPVSEETALGNLGSKYAPSISGMNVYDPSSSKRDKIDIQGGYIQFIALKGVNYFKNSMAGDSAETSSSKKQLKLDTFALKPTLSEKREKQQSETPQPKNPPPEYKPPIKCDETAAKICNELLGTDFDPKVFDSTDNVAYNKCYREQGKKILGGAVSTCGDSPLYLYGTEGTRLKVKVGTPIYLPNVFYDPVVGFDITLGKGGSFTANNREIQSLVFDYKLAVKKVIAPTSGFLVEKEDLPHTLQKISSGFGLNEIETDDLVKYAKQNITKQYIMVGYYDGQTSKKILPLFFDPAPDNYHNIVFYFKQYDNRPLIKLEEPSISKLERNGFTAIEISYILK